MRDDFEAMKSRITEYFHRVSDEQLKTDLEKAGYSYYKNIKIQVIDSFLAEDEFFVVPKPKGTINMDLSGLIFEEFNIADSYDNYGYKLAA